MVAGGRRRRSGTKRTTAPGETHDRHALGAWREGESGRAAQHADLHPDRQHVGLRGTRRACTLLFEDGTTAETTFTTAGEQPHERADVGADFPDAAGKRFGAVVESLGGTPAQIVVERAMYSNADGVVWAAGTNALATKLQ